MKYSCRYCCSSPTALCSAVFAGEEHLQRRCSGMPTRAEKVCLRNPQLIKGYFLPRPTELYNPYLNKDFVKPTT
jgi:hypothetical protein